MGGHVPGLDDHLTSPDSAPQPVSVIMAMGHDSGLDDDLMSLLDEAGISYRSEHISGYMVGPGVDYSSLARDTVTILGAVGGLGGIAAILKAFFGRHKGTTVKFGENGQVLEASGLSVDDIIRLVDACDQRMPLGLVIEAKAEIEESRQDDGEV